MIGIAIPAHNEESEIGACLDAVLAEPLEPTLAGEPVAVHVVLDATMLAVVAESLKLQAGCATA